MDIQRGVYFLILVFGPVISCTNSEPDSLEKMDRDFQTEPGLSLQLIASEPIVVDPVAFTFDEKYEMYVVEHRGYPDPAEGGKPAGMEGRIAKLSDMDHDGVYDRRVEYAQDFSYPNGILYWEGGVFVTCAPDIFYLKDTTGDGIADVRKVVLTGFYDTKTAQIRMSHPTLGLDGWIYVTGGLNGGEIFSPEYAERKKVVYNTGDGRFDPKTFEFQVTGGNSQFGLTFDPFGRRFGCSNRHPVQHIVIEPEDLERNPYLLQNETIQNVSKIQEEAVVYPISEAVTTADFIPKLIGRSHKGTFTSASGLLIYADQGLGARFQNNIFVCESAQNLVQCQKLMNAGVSFKSEIESHGREFFASKDQWFRPVFLGHGPQPGLYVADMHRKVIDHPSYVPEEIRSDLDFESGRDMGRIYRLVSTEIRSQPPAHLPWSTYSLNEIASLLLSEWEWQRSMAFQTLLERKDTSVSGVLRRQILKADLVECRVRSLWALHILGTLDQKTHLAALNDASPLVREQAVHIARASTTEQYPLIAKLMALSEDPDVRVRFLTTLVLGELSHDGALIALAQIAVRDGTDQWSRAAVLSGVGNRLESFLKAFKEQSNIDSSAFRLVMQELGQMLGIGGTLTSCQAHFRNMMIDDNRADWKVSTCLGLLKGIVARSDKNEGINKNAWMFLQSGFNSSELLQLGSFSDWVEILALDKRQPISNRRDAILLLGYMPTGKSFPVLEEVMSTQHEVELQIAAVQALTTQGEKSGVEWLLDRKNWPSYTPQIQSVVLSILFSKPDYLRMLLEAVKKDIVSATEISATDRERLMDHKDTWIKNESASLFRELESGSRMEIYQDYQRQMKLEGSPEPGRLVFNRACSICHSYAGFGGQVGPDLTGVKHQPADALLLHILVPNYEVYTAYQAMTFEISSGQSFLGCIQSESATAITIRTASGTEETLLRSTISGMKTTGKSLMPDGLEQVISPEEMAHLITFLKSGSRR